MSALKRICRKYFDYYDKQSGLFQSASISLISKHALPDLATTIRDLHQTLADVNPDVVQQFNRQKQYRWNPGIHAKINTVSVTRVVHFR